MNQLFGLKDEVDAHGIPYELAFMITSLTTSLEEKGKNLSVMGYSLVYVFSHISRTEVALKEETDARSAKIKVCYDNLSRLEEDFFAATNEGFTNDSFMNDVDHIYVFYPNIRVSRDLVNLDNIVVNGMLVKRE